MRFLFFIILVFANLSASAALVDDLQTKIAHKKGMDYAYIKFSNDKKLSKMTNFKIVDLSTKDNAFKAEIVDQYGQTSQITGNFQRGMIVPVFNRSLRAKHLINHLDITSKTVPYSSSDDIIKDVSELNNQVLKVSYQKNKPIKKHDIQGETVIKKGQNVTLKFVKGGISLETLAKALESGAKGETIRLKNLDSDKNIKGKILDSETVIVGN